MNNKNCCERCSEKTNVFKMSFFNTDMLCRICLDIEEAHPEYTGAVEEEMRQVNLGNYAFKGVGLPKDLKVEGSNE